MSAPETAPVADLLSWIEASYVECSHGSPREPYSHIPSMRPVPDPFRYTELTAIRRPGTNDRFRAVLFAG